MDAARKLNTIGVLDEFWLRCSTPREADPAERGYIFMRDIDGTLTLAAGRNSRASRCWTTRPFRVRCWMAR